MAVKKTKVQAVEKESSKTAHTAPSHSSRLFVHSPVEPGWVFVECI